MMEPQPFQILFEMETIAEDLSSFRMSKIQQNRVLMIHHCIITIRGHFMQKIANKNHKHDCQHAIVRIRVLSSMGYEEGKTKNVRTRFAALIKRAWNLESWINQEIQDSGIFGRLKAFAQSIITKLLAILSLS